MVTTSMALVPVVTGVASFFLLRAVHRESMSVLASCMSFVAALVVGMLLSFGFVVAFGSMLHGDGALAIIAAPITGAIVSIPVALVFAVVLVIVWSRRLPP
jgi:hypothetical protein